MSGWKRKQRHCRADLRTGSRWFGVAAVMAVLLSGCADGDAVPFATATSNHRTPGYGSASSASDEGEFSESSPEPGEPPVELPEIEDVPEGTGMDPLAGLPVTDSTASLLVSTFDDQVSVRLLDLGTRESIAVAGPDLHLYPQAIFDVRGDVVSVAGPRTVNVMDSATGVTRAIDLPDTVPGSIRSIFAVDDAVDVSVQLTDDAVGRDVLLELDGSVRCLGPEGAAFHAAQPGTMWSHDAALQMNSTTCEVSPGHLPKDIFDSLVVMHGTDVYSDSGLRTEGTTVRNVINRFDLTTGELAATNPDVQGYVTDFAVHGDDLFALVDGYLMKLDPTTLEVTAKTFMFDCGGAPYFVQQAHDLYVLDDCSGTLLRVDPSTGTASHGWYVPNDNGSDIQINSLPTDDGIWMVDSEQTGVPYLFDTTEDRFERMPFNGAQMEAEGIYGMDFDVFPHADG